MSILDDHLLKRLPEPRQQFAPFLTQKDQLLWANYQRPTFRLYLKFMGEGVLWLLGLGLVVFFGVVVYNDSNSLLENIGSVAIVLMFLITIFPRFKSFLQGLIHHKSNLYGLTETHLLVLSPWKKRVERHALAQLPQLKIFARVDGTFTVSRLHEITASNSVVLDTSSQYLKEEILFLDAIGDQKTIALIQQLQQKAKAARQ